MNPCFCKHCQHCSNDSSETFRITIFQHETFDVTLVSYEGRTIYSRYQGWLLKKKK